MYKRLGLTADRARKPEELRDATHLILPGVGAFDNSMQMLNRSGLREKLEELVIGKKIPVLGVCVGMQMLSSGSDEGEMHGLNWIPGRVRLFSTSGAASKLPLPHMGWNDLKILRKVGLLDDFDAQPRFYFLHSYYFDSEDKRHVVASAEYGVEFDCIVHSDNIYGIQCHPEKSHNYGARLLRNFARS
jgi:glutamine amidotransferase